MSKEAMKLALGKIKSARDCHPNAVDTLLFEAEETLEIALREALAEASPTAGYAKKIESLIMERDALKAKLTEQPAQQEPVDSMGMPLTCGKPLCSPGDHHPLCKLAEQPAQRKQVGDSRFESWYSEDFDPKGKGTKQQMREAYEAGMNDPAPQPAQQEPVATLFGSLPVYDTPSPAQRTWVGLTDIEYDTICGRHSAMKDFDFLEDIEAKLKEKNT